MVRAIGGYPVEAGSNINHMSGSGKSGPSRRYTQSVERGLRTEWILSPSASGSKNSRIRLADILSAPLKDFNGRADTVFGADESAEPGRAVDHPGV